MIPNRRFEHRLKIAVDLSVANDNIYPTGRSLLKPKDGPLGIKRLSNGDERKSDSE